MDLASIASWASVLATSAVPEDARRAMNHAYLDTTAVMVAGLDTATAQATLRTAVRSLGHTAVLGTRQSSSSAAAAFAMASAANALDYDDGHRLGGGIHIGSCVFPVLFAIADDRTTIDDLRIAAAAGYEVAIRLGYLLSPAHDGGAYHGSGTAVAIGAAAAAARLLDFDEEQTDAAIRVAAAHAPVARATSPGAREAIGWAAATAVNAIHLVMDGLTAPYVAHNPAPFDDTLFRGAVPTWVDSLGSRFESVQRYTKPYASCRAGHSALDAISELLRESMFTVSEVDRIEVGTSMFGSMLGVTRPLSLEQAQFSIPFAIALLLERGRVGAREMSESDRADERILEVARRVSLFHDPTIDGVGDYPATITVTTRSGSFTRSVLHASGSAGNPLGADAFEGKLVECLARYADSGLAGSTPVTLAKLTQVPDMGGLRELLSPN